MQYGAEMMESSVKSISRPVIDRLPVGQLDDFACRQLDRVSVSVSRSVPSFALSFSVGVGARDAAMSLGRSPGGNGHLGWLRVRLAVDARSALCCAAAEA